MTTVDRKLLERLWEILSHDTEAMTITWLLSSDGIAANFTNILEATLSNLHQRIDTLTIENQNLKSLLHRCRTSARNGNKKFAGTELDTEVDKALKP